MSSLFCTPSFLFAAEVSDYHQNLEKWQFLVILMADRKLVMWSFLSIRNFLFILCFSEFQTQNQSLSGKKAT